MTINAPAGGSAAGTQAGGTAAAGAAGAAGPIEVGQQHHMKDAMNYLVQPIAGFGNFMGRQVADEIKDGKKKHDAVSVDVYQVSLTHPPLSVGCHGTRVSLTRVCHVSSTPPSRFSHAPLTHSRLPHACVSTDSSPIFARTSRSHLLRVPLSVTTHHVPLSVTTHHVPLSVTIHHIHFQIRQDSLLCNNSSRTFAK